MFRSQPGGLLVAMMTNFMDAWGNVKRTPFDHFASQQVKFFPHLFTLQLTQIRNIFLFKLLQFFSAITDTVNELMSWDD